MATALPEVTYRPGWSFRWDTINSVPALFATVNNTDSETGEPRTATYTRCIADPVSPEKILAFLLGIEDHETREWLRLDGHLVSDPHADALLESEAS